MKSSINIKYDINDKHLIDEYYATGSHTEIIRGVMSGVMNKQSCNAHIAYGPYGSGKSYVSVILANIVSKNVSKRALNHLTKQFLNVDIEVNNLINEFNNKSKRKYIVAKVNGYEGSLKDALLDSVFEALNENDFSHLIPGSINTIKDIIKRWKKNFEETYFNLQIEVGKEYIAFDDFLKKIDEGDEEAILFFTSIYERLTAGAKLDLNNNQDIIKSMEEICKSLNKKNYGLLIIYDEFGRCLQNIKHDEINLFMQTMQDLAELSNNALSNFSLLFITHKPISYYFQNYNLETRSEFAKIEKRYNVYDIKSDYTTFLNIVNKVIKTYDISKITKGTLDYHIENVKKYRFFSSLLNDLEVEKLILKNAFPLHPIAVYLLPRISSIFGQNERTLFTFLLDESAVGFKGYINKNDGTYYYADTLVDYFFINIDQSYVENYKVYNLFIKYKSLINAIPEKVLRENTLRILKFIFIWSICDGNSTAKLDTNLLSYGLDIDHEEIDKSIKELLSNKIIRFDNIRKTWEICESSPLDIDEEIRKIDYQTSISQRDLLDLFNRNNPYKIIYPKTYNDEHEMTRFCRLNYEKDIVEYDLTGDLVLHICLDKSLNKINDEKNIFGHIEIEFSSIENVLRRLYVIQTMKEMQYYKADKAIINELEFEESMLLNQLQHLYDYVFTKSCEFEMNDRSLSFENLKTLEMFVGDYFENTYRDTITIVNDQINMYEISNVQKKALITVLDLILEHNTIELEDFFIGAKPDYLVWYSIYMSEYRCFNHLIVNHIEDNNVGVFNDIMYVLTSPPYGLRPPVALLIIFFNIADHLRDILFYANDNFIATITGEDIYHAIIDNDIVLTYKYSHFDYINRDYINNLLAVFPLPSERVANRSLAIQLCSALNNWYLNLPVVVQQKAIPTLGMKEISFLRIIESAKTDPQKSIEMLQKSFLEEEISETKFMVENSFDYYLTMLTKQILEKNQINDIESFLEEMTETQKKDNLFLKTISKGEDLITAYANDIEELDIHRWPISTFKMLEKAIQEDIDKIDNNIESDEVLIKGKKKAIIKTELSIKGETLKLNIENIINATQKYLTKKEIEYIVYELFDNYVE